MAKVRLADGDTLLDYGLVTDPDPLMASSTDPSVQPLTGALSIQVAAKPNTTVYCTSISFQIAVGTSASDLTNDPSAIQTVPVAGWVVGTFDTDQSLFTVTNTTASTAVAPVTFQMTDIQVNPGTVTTLTIIETSSTSQNGPFTQQRTTIGITRVPYGFFFGNFSASAPAVVNQPSQNQVTLAWTGSADATYTIYFDDDTTGVDVSNQRTYLTPPLTHDTTFLLRAQDVDQGLFAEESVTITVLGPDLVANMLTVGAEQATNAGSANIGVLDAGTLTATTLTVQNGATIGGGTDAVDLQSQVRITSAGEGVPPRLAIGTFEAIDAAIEVVGAAATLRIGPEGSDPNTIQSSADLILGAETAMTLTAKTDVTATASNNVTLTATAADVAINAGIDCNITCTRTVNLASNGGVFTFNQQGHINAAITVNPSQPNAGVLYLYANTSKVIAGLGAQEGSQHAAILFVGDDTYEKQAGFIHLLDGFYGWAHDWKYRTPDEGPPTSDDDSLRGMAASSASALHHGRGELRDGHATIELPEPFSRRTDPATLTVHLTPESADSKGLAVVSRSRAGFTVRELHGGTGSYPFSYMAVAERK